MRTLLILATATACTGSSNYWVTYQPRHAAKTTTAQKAKIAITDAGREVESSDEGVVLTKWFRGDGFPNDVQFQVRIVIAPDGYDIAALCKRDSGDDCGGKRPRFVLDTIAKIEAGL